MENLSVWEKYVEVSNLVDEQTMTSKIKKRALKLLNEFETAIQELKLQSRTKLA